MTASDAFRIWAPPHSVWSQWAKPVLFSRDFVTPQIAGTLLESHPPFDLQAEPDVAVVLDIPGELSVGTGVRLARRGFRPVPLFNSAPDPASFFGTTVVDTASVRDALASGALHLAALVIPPEAPPVFLLDSNRKGRSAGKPGQFDNRSVVFPQDFPSARFLIDRGIRRIVLVQSRGHEQPEDDLAHVLLRWQEGGLQLFVRPGASPDVQPLRVSQPSHFRSLWYRALVSLGLRRHSAGGFGSVVPEPSSGRGYG